MNYFNLKIKKIIFCKPNKKMDKSLQVIKRDGRREEVSFDKVLKRIKQLSFDLDVNPHIVAQKINARIFDGIHTSELDVLGSEICAASRESSLVKLSISLSSFLQDINDIDIIAILKSVFFIF